MNLGSIPAFGIVFQEKVRVIFLLPLQNKTKHLVLTNESKQLRYLLCVVYSLNFFMFSADGSKDFSSKSCTLILLSQKT